MKKMNTAIIIFMSVAVVVLTIALTVITKWYISLCDQYEQSGAYIDEILQDKKLLLDDKREQAAKIEELYADNVRLAGAVKELRVINSEITAINKQLMETAEKPKEPQKERLPEGLTNTFRSEDYRQLNLPGSDQLALQRDKNCMTEKTTGLRVWVDNTDGERYYCVALAGAYGSTIGDTWRVTLECGTVFNVIYADYQHPDQINNPDPNDFGSPDVNYDGEPTTEVLEFVADYDVMPRDLYESGTMTYLDKFGGMYGHGGNIVKMKYLGMRWEL